MRPKLKEYVFFAPLAEGILFRSLSGDLVFRGKDIYRWIERLIPYLDGRHTTEALCQGLNEKQRRMVLSLIQKLIDAGLARDVEAEMSLPEMDEPRHMASLAYLEQFHRAPHEALAQVQQAKVLVAGDGPAYLATVQSLVDMGFIHILTWATSEQAEQALGIIMARSQEISIDWKIFEYQTMPILPDDCTAVVYAGTQYGDQNALQLLQQCRSGNKLFLDAGFHQGQLYVGPLTQSAQNGCTACVLTRLDDAQNVPEDASAQQEAIGPVYAAVLGYLLSYWLFCALAGIHFPEKGANSLLQFDLDTLSLEAHTLQPWPHCPYCKQNMRWEKQEAPKPIDKASMPQTRADRQGFLEQVNALIDTHVGILKQVSEGSFAQLPLYQMQVMLHNPVTAAMQRYIHLVVPASTPDMARYQACYAGLAAYARALIAPDDIHWQTSMDQTTNKLECVPVFASGLTLWEWIGVGLLENTRQLAWSIVDPGNNTQPLEASTSAPYRKMLCTRFGLAVEVSSLLLPPGWPGIALVFHSQDTIFDICVDVEQQSALERGLIRLLQHAHNQQEQSDHLALDLLDALKQQYIHDLFSPTTDWADWSPKALEQCQKQNMLVLHQPILVDPALEALGFLAGYIGIQRESLANGLPLSPLSTFVSSR